MSNPVDAIKDKLPGFYRSAYALHKVNQYLLYGMVRTTYEQRIADIVTNIDGPRRKG